VKRHGKRASLPRHGGRKQLRPGIVRAIMKALAIEE
jgi:predicted RNA binding protein YcfA (HicA-like mRNA interferase family)